MHFVGGIRRGKKPKWKEIVDFLDVANIFHKITRELWEPSLRRVEQEDLILWILNDITYVKNDTGIYDKKET